MKIAGILTFALGALTFSAPAYADGKAAIKPPVVTTPAPLQPAQLQGGPQPINCCQPQPAPAAPRIVSRTVSEPDQGLKLDSDFVLSMTGGVGTGVSDVALGGGSGFGFSGNVGAGRDFGRNARFSRAIRSGQFRGRRSGRRGFSGRRGGGRR